MSEGYVAIVNPAAGGGRCGKRAPTVLQSLREAGLDVEERRTAAPRDAIRIAREAFAGGCRRFIAVGGDGTGWEVLNGLAPEGLGARASLGFLPLGTGNSFLRDFTSGGADAAVTALAAGRRRTCDVLRLRHADGEVYFINLFTYGFATDVTVNSRRYKRYGAVGYVLGVLHTIRRLHYSRLPLRVEGGDVDGGLLTFVSVCNTRYTAGAMQMAPAATASDGFAHLVRVAPMSRLELMRAFPRIYKGTHVDLPAVSVQPTHRIDFEIPAPVQVMVDGEVEEMVPESVEVLPGALEICV